MNDFLNRLKTSKIFTNKKLILFILKLLVTVGLIIYISTIIDTSLISTIFTSANYLGLSIVVLLGIVNIVLQFLRWHILVSKKDSSVKPLDSFKSMMCGFSAGIFTPMRVGEYLGRKFYIENIRMRSIIVLTLIDKIFLLIIIALFGSLSVAFILHFYFEVNNLIIISFTVLLIIIFYLIFQLLFSNSLFHYIRENLLSLVKRFKIFKIIFEEMYYLDYKINLKLSFIAFLNFIIITFQFSLLIFSFGGTGSFIYIGIAAILVFFTKSFFPAITIGDFGIREFASIYYFGLFSISPTIATMSAFTLFIVNLLIPSAIGLIFIYLKR